MHARFMKHLKLITLIMDDKQGACKVYYDRGSKDAKNYPEFIYIIDGKSDMQK